VDATTPPAPSPGPRRLPAWLLAVALVAAPLAACGDDDGTVTSPASTSGAATPAPTTTVAGEPTAVASGVPTSDVDLVLSISYAGGEITGDTGRVPVKLGSRVRIVVTSDVVEELHLHVYDRTVPVAPGSPAEIVFTADVPGQIELELHEASRALVRLVIS
jgi:hypothetical protein